MNRLVCHPLTFSYPSPVDALSFPPSLGVFAPHLPLLSPRLVVMGGKKGVESDGESVGPDK